MGLAVRRKRTCIFQFRGSSWTVAALLALAAGCFTIAAPASAAPDVVPSAKFLPLPEGLSAPDEQKLLNEVLQKIATAKDPRSAIATVDAALAKAPQPTQLRGYLQWVRASLLAAEDDFPRAVDAIEESVRLLPGYSAPLISAASLYAYANQPAKAADYFLRAAEVDPETARTLDDYEVGNIIRRLKFAREEQRLKAISDRLLEIGWIGSALGSRSLLAREAIERRLRDGDVTGARALVSKLLVPEHSHSLLTLNEIRPVWGDIERWAGPRLAQQWAIYVNEARQRWTASRSVDTVKDYLDALRAAGHYHTAIRDIYPMFTRKLDKRGDYELMFVVTGMAAALAHENRWSDVDALFERTQQVWPLGTDANAINIAANRARFLLFAGRYHDALRVMDAAIAEGRKWQVNPDALAGMHHYRACILHELGRDAEAGVSMSMALSGLFADQVALMHLCMRNEAAARRVLLDALEHPSSRGSAIAFMQKPDTPAYASEWSRTQRARSDALRTDPALLAEVAKHGRVLPFSSSEGAPPERK